MSELLKNELLAKDSIIILKLIQIFEKSTRLAALMATNNAADKKKLLIIIRVMLKI